MSQPRKKPKKSRNICTWIRERISPYCHGVKTKAGNPAHINRNDDILYHFQVLKTGSWGRGLCRLKNSDFADHFSSRKTFYFTADGRSATKEVLVNIDIDCHGSGSLEGAIAFAEHLRDTCFPDLYFEESTNGNGVHGYIVAEKGDLGDEGLNGALSILDRWLKHELSKGNWDVEDVEIKGNCPEFTWGRVEFDLKTYKSGQLAKLPREALSRSEELLGTTRVGVEELRRLKVPAADESVAHRAKKAAKETSVISVSECDNWEAEKSVVSYKVEKKTTGSIAGRHFDEGELARLKGSYLSLARELLCEKKLVATGRKVVTEEDLAIFLMLLNFFSRNMNADGSLPTARYKEMWTALSEAGDIERSWCHHRHARMRNYLTTKDLLEWEEEDFVAGVVDDDGRFIPGQAAKWKAGEELMAMMEKTVEPNIGQDGVVLLIEKKEEGESILYGCNKAEEDHEAQKEEGESTLYGYNKTDHYYMEGKVEGESTLYGYNETGAHISTPSSRQSESILEEMDRLGIVIPLQKPRFTGYTTGRYRMAA